MKKLIAWLGSIVVIASTSTLLISCGTINRFNKDDVTLKDEIANQVLLSVKNKLGDSSIDDLTIGNIFNDIDYQEILLKMIDETLAGIHIKSNMDIMNNNLKFIEDTTSAKQHSTNTMNQISAFKFFDEYTKSIVSGIYLDNTMVNLNGKIDIKNGDETVSKKYAIFFEDNKGDIFRWQHRTENKNSWKEQLPSLEILTNKDSKFYLIANDDAQKDKLDSEPTPNNSDVLQFSNLEVLPYRFQNHFKTKIQNEMFNQLIAASYLKGQLIQQLSDDKTMNKRLNINNSSDVVRNVHHNSPFDPSNTTSKIKMVWTYRTGASKIADATKIINNPQEGFVDSDGTLKENESIFNAYNALLNTQESPNSTKLGSDPFLGLKGFNGFVKNNSDNTSVDPILGTAEIPETAKEAIAKTEKPAIFTNGTKGYDSVQTNFQDIVFVIPVYFNDLLMINTQLNPTSTSAETQNNEINPLLTRELKTNDWIDLQSIYFGKDKNNNAIIFDKDMSKITFDGLVKAEGTTLVKLNGDGDGSVTYNFENNNYTVKLKKVDEYTAYNVSNQLKKDAGDFVQDGDTYSYNVYLSNDSNANAVYKNEQSWIETRKSSKGLVNLSSKQKSEIIDQLLYISSNDQSIQDSAKNTLYTEYLQNKDAIKYQPLFDEIEKYINEEKENWD